MIKPDPATAPDEPRFGQIVDLELGIRNAITFTKRRPSGTTKAYAYKIGDLVNTAYGVRKIVSYAVQQGQRFRAHHFGTYYFVEGISNRFFHEWYLTPLTALERLADQC